MKLKSDGCLVEIHKIKKPKLNMTIFFGQLVHSHEYGLILLIMCNYSVHEVSIERVHYFTEWVIELELIIYCN